MANRQLHVYLSGGMEYAKDDGKDWREEMEFWIKKNLHHKVFNPQVKSSSYLRKILPRKDFRRFKSTDIDRYQKIVRRFVEIDTKEIATVSDYVVCLWNESAMRGAGTKGEITIAKYFKKPIYLVTRSAKKELPGWILGCITIFFNSFDELKEFLLLKYSVHPSHPLTKDIKIK